MKDYTKKPLSIFVDYIRDEKKLFILDMCCAVLVSAVDLVFPYVSKNAMQTYLPQRMFTTFFVVMLILVSAYLLKSLLYYIITVLGHRMGVHIEANMRRDLFRHVQTLGFDYFDRNRTGTVMSRLTSDLFEITELAHHGPENIIICTVTIVGAMILMFTIQWQLALVLLILLPLCIWFTLSQRLKMRDANIEVKKKTGVIYSAIENSVSGIRTAKAFANEDLELVKFDEANGLYRSAKSDYYKAMGLFQSGMEFTLSIMPVAVIAVGGLLIMCGRMDYIDLITFTLYVSTFVTPVRKLAMFIEQYMQGSAGFTRFLELMNTKPTVTDAPNAVELGEVTGEVELCDVCFGYGEAQVLSHVSLKVEPGRCLALIGSSGGGKTTMLRLLMGLEKPRKGRITGTQGLRFSAVFQEDRLLPWKTAAENVALFSDDASARAMLWRLGLGEAADDKPDRLSGGMKRRVALARALCHDCDVLVLDEPLTGLDAQAKTICLQTIDEAARGKTLVMTGHDAADAAFLHAKKVAWQAAID